MRATLQSAKVHHGLNRLPAILKGHPDLRTDKELAEVTLQTYLKLSEQDDADPIYLAQLEEALKLVQTSDTPADALETLARMVSGRS